MADEERKGGEQQLVPRRLGDVDQLVEELSKSSVVGIAICDAELRYLKINDTLAAFNGIPADAHIGKTVPEIIGQAALAVEPVMKSVLTTGQSAMNLEVVAELPTRREQGHWIVNFLPVKDSSGKVNQIIALVIETTRLRKFEQWLLAMMRNLAQIKDQARCVGSPDRAKNGRIESLVGSVNLLEQCVQDMRGISVLLEPPFVSSNPAVPLPSHSHLPPSGIPSHHEAVASKEHLAGDFAGNGADLLTRRETQILRLLANGKSNKEIAPLMNVTVNTVATYRARIMGKLHIHSIAHLIRFAVQNRLVEY